MAALPIIRMGDPTSHGGYVIEGHPDATIYDKPIAGVGHMVVCPACKGAFPIVQGVHNHTIMGVNTAVHGMKTACGAVLIATQSTATIDVPPGPVARASSSILGAGNSAGSSRATTSKDGQFNDVFRLLDKDTGKPLANVEYAIERDNGDIEHGITDENGHTILLSSTDQPEDVKIYV